MVKFDTFLSTSTPNCFKFINQRTVKVIGIFVLGVSDYVLSKSDVILAIKEYIKRFHSVSDKPIRSEGMDFNAFQMHDLVPYFYSLINLYLSVGFPSYSYHRFLPELKLTRFCHLPFEAEIIIEHVSKPTLRVKYAILETDKSRYHKYVCLGKYDVPMAFDTLFELESALNFLYPDYHILLWCDLPF